jgi:hypothetical protein
MATSSGVADEDGEMAIYLPDVLPSAHNFASRTQKAISRKSIPPTYFPSPDQKPPTWVG